MAMAAQAQRLAVRAGETFERDLEPSFPDGFGMREADQYDQLLAVAADLVRRKAAVIYSSGNANSAMAANAATTTIPIVCRRVLVALGFVLGLAITLPAQATKLWDWGYSAPGIAASGTLTTADTADSEGFYLITGITGTRNGETIIGLQRTGTAIPGNDGYPVDNLIRVTSPQMTSHGFGFSTSGGNYANPFYASFRSTEFFSIPSKLAHTELPITFTATISSASAPR